MLLIIIVCIGLSGYFLLKYFYFGSGTSKYGDRLDGIESVPITDDAKMNIIGKIKEEESVTDAKIDVIGKRICIRIVFSEDTLLDTAKNTAVKIIDEFSEEEQAFYDIEFTLVSPSSDTSDGFTIMGNKNVSGSNLVWNNNNATSTDE